MKRAALDSVTKLIRTFRISTEPEPVTIPPGPLKRALRHIAAPAVGILFVLTSGGTGNAADRLISKSPPVITERGPHEQTWSTVSTYKMEDGREITSTNSYVQIATGLNRWDAQAEQWVPADTEIEIINGKGVGRKTQHQAIFAANVRADDGQGLIDLKTPDGARLVMQPVGIALVEADTGRSAFLSVLKDSIGVLVDRNTIVYEDAFEQFDADIRIQSRLEGLECDVVLQERIDDALIQQFGLNPDTVRVEVWHEVISRSDAIERVSPIPRKDGEFQANHNVDIGLMRIDSGDAFSLGGAERRLGNGPENEIPVAVAKELATIEGIEFLIESIPFREIERELESLPAPPQARVIDRAKLEKAWAQRSVKGNRERPVSLAMNKGVDAGDRPVAKITRKERQFALSGYLIDYPVLLSSQTNYVLKGNTTYWVTGPVNLYGTTVLEGGAVIKFTNYTSLSPHITVKGDFECRTDPYRPAILTAEDDNTVGENLFSSSGSPTVNPYYAWYNLRFDWTATNELEVHDIITRYAHNGIGFYRTAANHVWNVQALNCDKGIETRYANLNLHNILIHNTRYAIATGEGSNRQILAEHLTVNTARELLYRGPYTGFTMFLTNSLHSAVTNDTWDGLVSDYVQAVSTTDFQTVGAGGHYLAANSAYRNAGTSSLTERGKSLIEEGTTYAPLEIASDFSTATVLSPRVQRDTDAPDLGFHYQPLDYLIGERNLGNTTLTLTNGVAVGVTGAYGLDLQSGAKLISEGSPLEMNRLTPYYSVQELPAVPGGTAAGTIFRVSDVHSTLPEVALRYTRVTHLANRNYLLDTQNYNKVSRLELSNCDVFGSRLYMLPFEADYRPIVVALTNNVLERPAFSFMQGYYTGTEPVTIYMRNNYVRNGGMGLQNVVGLSAWAIHDNLFDNCSLSTDPNGASIGNSHNGYYNTTALPGGSMNKTLTSLDFVAGPLGPYYYPAGGGSGGLTNLLDAGSRTAAAAELYHYTTQTSQAKEESTQVDIGFHYPALIKVRFVGTDTETQGNWKGRYGEDGFDVFLDSASYPEYASTAISGASSYTWAASTSETRALERGGTGRIAACWYSSSSFEIQLTQSSGEAHRLAMYCLDWNSGREQTITIKDAVTGTIYDTRPVAGFYDGQYFIWDIIGNASIVVEKTGGANAVVSGLFFGPGTKSLADRDGDGVPDVSEDSNGNAIVETGETDWTESSTGPAGLTGLQLFTPLN